MKLLCALPLAISFFSLHEHLRKRPVFDQHAIDCQVSVDNQGVESWAQISPPPPALRKKDKMYKRTQVLCFKENLLKVGRIHK